MRRMGAGLTRAAEGGASGFGLCTFGTYGRTKREIGDRLWREEEGCWWKAQRIVEVRDRAAGGGGGGRATVDEYLKDR